jgi:transposase
MDHIAIDLGGSKSQICVRSSDGTILEERRVPTAELSLYLAKRSKTPSRVIVETCAESFTVADSARQLGCEVRVVPATLARALGVGARRTKTDERDARSLSEASCRMDLPSVHIPSLPSRQRKTQCGMREALVASRTQLINTVRGWTRGQGIRIRAGGAETLPARVRQAVSTLPSYVERQLGMIDQLTAAIREADEELEREARADPTCRRLMSVPGVGPVTAIRFVSAIDQVERFHDAHSLQSYLGLAPGEWSSGERQRRTGITKAGCTQTRRTLVQAAWVHKLRRPSDPASIWAAAVEKRRGKLVAIVALARKLAGVLYALWRDGTTYDSARGASSNMSG